MNPNESNHSFILVINLSLSGSLLGLEPIPGTQGVKWEYTLDGWPVHRRVLCTYMLSLGANLSTFWRNPCKHEEKIHNSKETVTQAWDHT